MYATYHALSWLLLLCYVSDSGDNVMGVKSHLSTQVSNLALFDFLLLWTCNLYNTLLFLIIYSLSILSFRSSLRSGIFLYVSHPQSV